jgi:putative transposase
MTYCCIVPQNSEEDVMPRQARLDVPGTLHRIIVRGIEKGRIVANDTEIRYVDDTLGILETGKL